MTTNGLATKMVVAIVGSLIGAVLSFALALMLTLTGLAFRATTTDRLDKFEGRLQEIERTQILDGKASIETRTVLGELREDVKLMKTDLQRILIRLGPGR